MIFLRTYYIPIAGVKSISAVWLMMAIGLQAGAFNGRSLNLVSCWPYGPPVQAIAIDTAGDRVYFGSGMGVYILDISTPNSPVKISEAIHMSNLINDLHFDNERLYATIKGKGIEIWDVSTPAAPYFLGGLDIAGDVPKAKHSGNNLYVANGNNGLRIIDVSNPINPQEIGSYVSGTYIRNLCVSGNYAFICDNAIGVRIIDILDPTNPVEVSNIYNPLYRDVTVKDNYLYVAAYSFLKSLDIVDISDIVNPHIVGSIDSMPCKVIAVDDTIAYAIADFGVYTANIADVYHPCRLGHYSTIDMEYLKNMAYHNHFLFTPAVDQIPGVGSFLLIFNVENPLSPWECGDFIIPSYSYGMYTAWSRRYNLVANSIGRLKVVSFTDFGIPTQISSYNNTLLFCYDVRAYWYGYPQVLAAMATGGGIEIANITDPFHPVFVGSYSNDLGVTAIDINQSSDPSWAWLLSWNTVYLFEIVNPSNPTYIRNMAVPPWGHELFYANGILYIAAGSAGLRIYRSSLDGEYGYLNTPGSAQDVKIVNKLAYVADSNGGLRIINVANPSSPVEIGACTTVPSAVKVCVIRPRAYVAAYDSGLYVVDVSDSTTPTVVEHEQISGQAIDVSARGDTICVLTFDRGFYFYLITPIGLEELKALPELSAFQTPTLVRNGKLSVNCVLPKACHVKLTLYNLLGQEVRCLAEISLSQGEHQFEVPLGRIAAGVYFIVLRSEGFNISCKIVVID